MSGRKYLIDLDLNGNKLIGAIINPLAVAPAITVAGGIFYNTATSTLEVNDGTNWVSQIHTVSGTGPVTVDTATAGVAAISVAEANGSTAGLLTAAGFTLLSGATDVATVSTLAQRDANGNISVATPTAASHAVTKSYVDQLNASGMHIVGSIDASTNPDYPAASSGAAYKVSTGGLIGGASGEAVSPGDVILAVENSAGGDQATVGTDYIVLQSNIEQATDVVAGYMRFASAAEMTDGASMTAATASALTPAQLNTYMADFMNDLLNPLLTQITDDLAFMGGNIISIETYLGGETHIELLTSGSSAYTVNHNMDQEVMVEVYDATTNYTQVVDVRRIDTNNVSIETAVNTTNDLVVMVHRMVGVGFSLGIGQLVTN